MVIRPADQGGQGMKSPLWQAVKSSRHHYPHLWGWMLVVGLSLLIGLGYRQLPLLIQQHFPHSVICEKGSIKRRWCTPAVLVRAEQVVTAPASGRLTLLAQEGQRVAAGAIVAELLNPWMTAYAGNSAAAYHQDRREEDRILVRALTAGVISFRLDGWENLGLDGSSGLKEFLQKGPKDRRKSSVIRTDGDVVARGDPVLRVIKTTGIWAVPTHVPCDLSPPSSVVSARVWEEGADSTLAFPLTGTVRILSDIVLDSVAGRPAIAIHLTDFPSQWWQERMVNLTIELEGPSGWILPARAVVEDAGTSGVLIAGTGEPQFVPVKVVDRDGRQVVVTGLASGQQVIITPGRISR